MILRGDFSSKTLRLTTNIQVLIPDHKTGPFRVAYLLHGLHGNQGTWLDRTMLPVYANDYNVIFVMPEANRSFYLNLKYGRKYYDYVSDELPQLCREIFNISANREDTAAIGCSMGGHGAFRLSMTKPEQYGFCGAISPACLYFKPILDALRADPSPHLGDPETAEIYVDLHCTYGEGLEYNADYDISELAKKFPPSAPKPKFYVSCGTEDSLRKENLRFRDEIKNTDFDYTYEEWAGGHDWYFFNEALKKTLEFWHKS